MSRGAPIVFFGTSEFAVPCLDELARAGETLALVVAQPDRPQGRGRRLESPPVIKRAMRLGLKTAQPEKASSPEFVEKLKALKPEFIVVAAYGQLLKSSVLNASKYGAVNLHPSRLPLCRGPSPIAWTILSEDDFSCNSVMKLDEGMDTGPIYVQETYALSPDATRGELEAFLAEKGAVLLASTLEAIRQGANPIPQDHSKATYSSMLTKEMREISWDESAEEIRRKIHALSPKPGAAVRVGGRLLKLLRAKESSKEGRPTGTVIGLSDEGMPLIGCGQGSVALVEVQPEGKKIMGGDAFVRGGGLSAGDVLGPARQ